MAAKCLTLPSIGRAFGTPLKSNVGPHVGASMLNKLKSIFAKTAAPEVPTPPPPYRPSTPLEILTPEGCQLLEPPKFAGKFISYLVASQSDVNTISIEKKTGHLHSTDQDLLQFLTLVAGANQLDTLLSQCKSVMFPSSTEGALGFLGCIQQPHSHVFTVFEKSPSPNLSWELRRLTRMAHDGSNVSSV